MAWKELNVDDWKLEIERGLEFRRRYGMEDQWATLEALYMNRHESQQKVAAPNIIAATGDSLLSTLSVPYPYITVKGRRQDTLAGARVVESIDNLLVCEMNMRRYVEASVLDSFLYGRGVLKIGYDSEWGWNPKFDVGSVLAMGTPLGASMTDIDGKSGNKIEFKDRRPGMPWIANVKPHDFVVPWGTPQLLNDAEWCVHRVCRHIDDIKSDPKYENKRNLRPVMSMRDFVESYQSPLKPYRTGDHVSHAPQDQQEEAEFCELWEIHDRRTGRVMVVATGHDKFLRNEPDLLQGEGLPFVALGFVPSPRSFWTTPDAAYLLQAQAELADITLQSQKHRRASVLKLMMKKGLLSEEAIDRLLDPEVGAIVEVDYDADDIRNVIHPFQPPPNLQLYQEAENTRRNARETVGFSRNQLGEYESTGRRTAYEASVVDRASQLRMSRRHLEIYDAYYQAFRKINDIIFEFWRTPRIAEVLDENGIQEFVTYTGPQLRGEYHYQIGFSNEPPDSVQSRKQNAISIYAQLAQDPTVDQIKLRQYLANAWNDPAFSSIFKPGILAGDQNALVASQMQEQAVQGVSKAGGDLLAQQITPQNGGGL